LTNIPCKVCADHSSGKHYGIYACDGCAGFFKRSIRRGRKYECKSRLGSGGGCAVDKTHRNQCRSCRLNKCLQVGMNKEAVQHERGPRHSTIRRQMMQAGMFGFGSRFSSSSGSNNNSNNNTNINNNFNNFHHIPHLLSPFPFPLPTSSSLSNETVWEMAVRLLFLTLNWVKNIPAFLKLPLRQQIFLLEERWSELFVLNAAQFDLNLHRGLLLKATEDGLVKESLIRNYKLEKEFRFMQEVVEKLKQMQIDPAEYSCLRGVVLFRPCFSQNNRDNDNDDAIYTLTFLQDQAQLSLNKYVETTRPNDPLRFGKLLLLLPSLSQISPFTIEKIFLHSTVGPVKVDRLISDLITGEAGSIGIRSGSTAV
ncbi:hypothetical protein HELRODRAFT_71774, partial [Helobdella robusta]|uniref:Nuclear receptor subfamily 2 group E member 1 n=1 Tax=Helobdella robusta TaxID=6412 RepID=T1G0R5_HELRO